MIQVRVGQNVAVRQILDWNRSRIGRPVRAVFYSEFR
jgi:hypothetical protein